MAQNQSHLLWEETRKIPGENSCLVRICVFHQCQIGICEQPKQLQNIPPNSLSHLFSKRFGISMRDYRAQNRAR